MRIAAYPLLLPAVLLSAAPALAQGPADIEISGTVGVVTDYRLRGVSMSGEDPALQASFEAEHLSGVYAGAFVSTLELGESLDRLAGTGGGDFGEIELDLYAGWNGRVASGFDLDLGLTYRMFPGADDRFAGQDFDSDFVEGRAALSYFIGPAQLRTGIAWAPDQAALAGDNVYLYGDAFIGIPTTPVTITAHLGYTDGALAADGSGDHLDWQLGAEYVLGPLTFGVNYVDTDAPSTRRRDAALIGSVMLGF
ncbi:MAG: TorF family putative porin [Parasphingopyxis sp.]